MTNANDRITNEKLAAKFATDRAARMAEQKLEMANDTLEAKARHARLLQASIDYAEYLRSIGVKC